ncbi:hypothetical protein AOLI_G00156670 [Acnodon oligacanthus]
MSPAHSPRARAPSRLAARALLCIKCVSVGQRCGRHMQSAHARGALRAQQRASSNESAARGSRGGREVWRSSLTAQPRRRSAHTRLSSERTSTARALHRNGWHTCLVPCARVVRRAGIPRHLHLFRRFCLCTR